MSAISFCNSKPKFPVMQRIHLFLAGFLITCLCTSTAASQNVVKAAYWPSYSFSAFPPSKINAVLYTHLFYAFADLNPQTLEVNVSAGNQKTAADFTPTLLRSNPSLKTLISIGGGTSDQNALARMAGDASSRKKFIDSTISLARRYGFHGLDLDWEFPPTAVDMQNLGRLFSEWKAAVHREAQTSGKPRLLLTAAVYFSQKFFLSDVVREYPAQSMDDNLDWINAMAYDFHGWWENKTGAPAALYDPASEVSTSFGVESWLAAGLSPQRVAMGMPLYGRSWLLKNEREVGIGAPAVGAGPIAGVLTFSQIQGFKREKSASEVFDTATVSAYAYAGNVWVGYDNRQSVARKVQHAKQKNLLGYFFWSVNQDINAILPQTASDTWDKWSVEEMQKRPCDLSSDDLKFPNAGDRRCLRAESFKCSATTNY